MTPNRTSRPLGQPLVAQPFLGSTGRSTLAFALLMFGGCASPGSSTRATPEPVRPAPATTRPVAHAKPVAPVQLDLGGTWDFERSRKRLVEVSPAMSAAAAAVDQARSGLALVRSATAPQLGFDLIGTNTNNPAQAFMGELNAHELSLAGGLGDTDPTTHVSAGLHASMLLWDGGRLGAMEVAAEAGVAAAGSAAEARAHALTMELNELWWGLFVTRELAEGVEARGDALAAALESAQARVDAGTGLRSDVLSLEASELARQAELIQARSTEASIQRSLDALLGIPPEAAHEFVELGEYTSKLGGAEQLADQLPELLADARSLRPDLRALQQQVLAREAELTAAERGSSPTLSAFADTWLDGGTPAYELDRGSYTVGAALNWNLYDGGTREARSGQARAGLRAARAQLATAVDAVELQLISAIANLEQVTATGRTAKLRRKAADGAYQEVDAGFSGGNVSLERWLGAEADAHAARIAESVENTRSWQARRRLELAIGYGQGTAQATESTTIAEPQAPQLP